MWQNYKVVAYRLVFGADFPPGDNEHGERNYQYTIRAIEKMKISKVDLKKIFQDNVKKLLHL
jgi:predicted TIM-barrel fold metal-dependent hydrolase